VSSRYWGRRCGDRIPIAVILVCLVDRYPVALSLSAFALSLVALSLSRITAVAGGKHGDARARRLAEEHLISPCWILKSSLTRRLSETRGTASGAAEKVSACGRTVPSAAKAALISE
jgi:hypothetical protein